MKAVSIGSKYWKVAIFNDYECSYGKSRIKTVYSRMQFLLKIVSRRSAFQCCCVILAVCWPSYCAIARPRFDERPVSTTIAPGRSASIFLDAFAGLFDANLTVQAYEGQGGNRSNPVNGARLNIPCIIILCYLDSISFTTPPLQRTTSCWFRLCSSNQGCVDSNTWTVVVDSSIPDPPEVRTKRSLTLNENEEAIIGTTLLNSIDVQGDTLDNLIYTVVTLPALGIINKNGVALDFNDTFTQADINNGVITFAANTAESGSDSFRFTVEDSGGATSGLHTFFIQIDMGVEIQTPTSFELKWGTNGSGDGQFNTPRSVAVDSFGNVYVADEGNNRIQKFNSNGVFITKWGSPGSADGQFDSPFGVAVDSSGNVYVADRDNHRIQKFDSSGTFLTKWGSFGSGDGRFRWLTGVAVDSFGNVYVTDHQNHRIQKFDSSGNFLLKWGTVGSADGQIDTPYGVAVDSSGNVYVAEANNDRIQKFDSSGTFLTKWGSLGSGDGQFNAPLDVEVDSSGNVYVAEFFNHRIQKFSQTSMSDIFGGESIDGFPGWKSSLWYLNYNVDFWPWIYHDEHGWQFVFEGAPEGTIFVWDFGLGEWLFFNENTYRWMFLMGGDNAGWAFTFGDNRPSRRFFQRLDDDSLFSVPPGLPVN